MKNSDHPNLLLTIAMKAMVDKGFEPDFPADAMKQLAALTGLPDGQESSLKDLTHLLWCSIDNDDSKDLDQLTVGENLPENRLKIYVAVADVDELVKLGTPLDLHAKRNTTSVYTGVKIFPMLPERLSTDLTSLNENEKRVALVIEMTLDAEGHVAVSLVYRAWVMNKAKLAYNGVGAWLEGRGPLPSAAKVPGLAENLNYKTPPPNA